MIAGRDSWTSVPYVPLQIGRVRDDAVGEVRQPVAEDEHAQPGEHEARHAVADHGDRGERVVDPGVLAQCGKNAEGRSQTDGDQQRGATQLGAHAELAHHHRGDRQPANLEGDPEVALDGVGQEAPVLHQHRAVETVLVQEQLQRLAVHPLTLERASWKAVDRDEDEERDGDQRESDQCQSLGDVGQGAPGQHRQVLPRRERRKAPGSCAGRLFNSVVPEAAQ